MRLPSARTWAVTVGIAAGIAALTVVAGIGSPTPRVAKPLIEPASGQSRRAASPVSTVTVAAAGDIAADESQAAATAALVRSLHPDFVLPLGDNAYPSGSAADYTKYADTWGEIPAPTRPVPGNHEYKTRDAAGYFGYFAAQVSGRPYYAWNAGGWRFYALNCEIGCGAGSEQERWLRTDLAAHRDRPALAYVHRPRYTCSVKHPPFVELDAVWTDLAAGSGQLVLAGHNHAYERFAPQRAGGRASSEGLRQFVVGTGGAGLYRLGAPCPNREAADDTSRGVLRLTLSPDSYAWDFVAVGGRVVDSGRQLLRRTPAAGASAATAPSR